MCAIQDEALLQKLLYDFFSWNRQLQGEHEPFASDFFDHRQVLQLLESLLEIRSYRSDMLEQLFIFDNVEVFQARPARQRSAAECRSVLSGLDCGRNFFVKQDGAQRNSQSKRFRERNHVRQHLLIGRWGKPVKCEPLSGSSESALNFVHDQQGALLLRKRARGAIELLGDGTDAAFTLNRLDQDSADVVGELSFEISRVIELHELEAWHERFGILTQAVDVTASGSVKADFSYTGTEKAPPPPAN